MKYTVEFWPGHALEVEANDEDDALFKAIEELGSWPGGSECTSNGQRFVAWVKER